VRLAAATCAGIRRLSLFSSLARGEAGPESDIDLLIEIDPESQFGLRDLVDLSDTLGKILPCPVRVRFRDATLAARVDRGRSDRGLLMARIAARLYLEHIQEIRCCDRRYVVGETFEDFPADTMDEGGSSFVCWHRSEMPRRMEHARYPSEIGYGFQQGVLTTVRRSVSRVCVANRRKEMVESVPLVRILISSPSDVADERTIAEEAIAKLNKTALHTLGLTVQALRSESDIYPVSAVMRRT
jgi:uncharacterized protein